ncbi:PPE family protein, partial [Mycobacterium sp.]|uniref:PPE family protein n=1 Tax=Mycobacterium sp. TaxID=1785 RepID=UPI002C1E7F08
MNFLVLPPEINSLRMFSGVGSEPMLAAAAAWDGLAAELGSAADSFSAVTTGLAGEVGAAWQGAASAAMSAAAAPYAGWLSAAAARAAGAAGQARVVAGVFEAARAAMVHPVAVAANRMDVVSLVGSNLFGQNWPAIAALESDYERMWAADVTAMAGYHSGASVVATQLGSWQESLAGVLGGLPALSGVAGGASPTAAA